MLTLLHQCAPTHAKTQSKIRAKFKSIEFPKINGTLAKGSRVRIVKFSDTLNSKQAGSGSEPIARARRSGFN
jgi:hypothetical protein